MTIFTVTTAADKIANDGKLSLREAVAQANASSGADTIRFASGLEGKTLVLTQGELLVTRDLTIDGDSNNNGKEVTISGGDLSRILRISGGSTDVSLRDLTLTRGHVLNENGGAIYSGGQSLRVTRCTISQSSVDGPGTEDGGGGAIYVSAYGSLVVDHSTIRDCRADEEDARGGAINAGNSSRIDISETRLLDNHLNLVSGSEYGQGIAVFGGFDAILTIRDSSLVGNTGGSRAISLSSGSNLEMDNCAIRQNNGGVGVGFFYSSAGITNSVITDNGFIGVALAGELMLENSTIAGNNDGIVILPGFGDAYRAFVSNSTITGNKGGIDVAGNISLNISNTIVAGNVYSDVSDPITVSNGHNIFGSDVTGAIVGDLQGVDPDLLFAAIDPDTGGGQVNAAGIVPLRNSVTNPALSGGDPLAALSSDQFGTARPLPAGSLPDIGAAERNQALSTHPSPNNDVLTGTDGIDTIAGKAGADLILGRGGNDSLHGEGGSDVLDGGAGNDLLDGGEGINLVRFGGSTAVTVDLVAGTAMRGSETDTLTSIRGAIGSSASDTFTGDGGPNWFQGGLGRDVATGGAARDLYDFDHVQDSLPGGASRDVITDFAPQSDRIDLTGIDADATQAGNQAFTWVGSEAFTGPGQLGYSVADGDVIVRGSTDADTAPEFAVQLSALTGIGGYAFFL